MSNARIFMLITALLEGILGIPLLGGSIVIGFGYVPLFMMFVLHIITLVLSSKEYKDMHGSIAGIITSCIAWIPIVGMICHLITALLLFLSYFKYNFGRHR